MLRLRLEISFAFNIDVERCVCGGKLRIIAAIEEPAVIERILTHLGLLAQPPPQTPARRVDIFSGGLIRKPARVLARADGRARLAFVQACGLRKIGCCEGRNFRENSGACVNRHAVDDAPGGG